MRGHGRFFFLPVSSRKPKRFFFLKVTVLSPFVPYRTHSFLPHQRSNGSIAILKQSKASTNVTGAKNFSKTVSARTLPRVLRKNKTISTQRTTLVVFSIPGSWTHPYRINTVFRQIRITPNETHSNRNNSSLVSICPPHRNSTGA